MNPVGPLTISYRLAIQGVALNIKIFVVIVGGAMRSRKPDLLVVLAILVVTGVLATSVAQGMIGDSRPQIEAQR